MQTVAKAADKEWQAKTNLALEILLTVFCEQAQEEMAKK
jgi:hypothetical protein